MNQPAFPAQRSQLSAAALANEVERRFGLRGNITCELFRAGLNDTYFVSTDSARFVLRVWRRGWRTDEDVAWELELLEHLEAQGSAVAGVIRDLQGESFWHIDAPEGTRQAALFRYAPGVSIYTGHYTAETARAFGTHAGKLHTAMDGFESKHARLELNLDHLLIEPLTHIEPRLSHRPEDLAYLRAVAKRLHEELRKRITDGLTWAACHGDLHGNNANWVDGAPTSFDFDCGGPGWRAYDIGVFSWAMSQDRQNECDHDTLWQAFLSGYRTQYALEPRDLDAVPYFVAARRIWMRGLHAELAATDGHAWMDDAYFDAAFKLLRADDDALFGKT